MKSYDAFEQQHKMIEATVKTFAEEWLERRITETVMEKSRHIIDMCVSDMVEEFGPALKASIFKKMSNDSLGPTTQINITISDQRNEH